MQDSSPTVETVLVPVDGSEESVRAVEYATAVAERYGASVHVLYVLGEEVIRGIETDTIDRDAVIDETSAFVETAESITADADVRASHSTAYGFSTTKKSRHPGIVVLDCAEDIDADFIVIPRESVTQEPGEILERTAEYVLLYASQPVLST